MLAVATAGLTTCGGGSVDPAPEPLHCEDIADGSSLVVSSATLDGDALTIEILAGYSWVAQPEVVAESGFTLVDVTMNGGSDLKITGTLDAGATTGTFTVGGKLTDEETTCDVSRKFTFTVQGDGSVDVALRYDLPISPRRHASIQMLGREGLEVDLAASGAGTAPIVWTPTGGAITASSDGRARWTLPTEPGVYQVEMLVDHGESGFTLDTLTLEVLG